jgi:hypothetical protein
VRKDCSFFFLISIYLFFFNYFIIIIVIKDDQIPMMLAIDWTFCKYEEKSVLFLFYLFILFYYYFIFFIFCCRLFLLLQILRLNFLSNWLLLFIFFYIFNYSVNVDVVVKLEFICVEILLLLVVKMLFLVWWNIFMLLNFIANCVNVFYFFCWFIFQKYFYFFYRWCYCNVEWRFSSLLSYWHNLWKESFCDKLWIVCCVIWIFIFFLYCFWLKLWKYKRA